MNFFKPLVSPLSLTDTAILLCAIVKLTGEPLNQSYCGMMQALELIKTQDLWKELNKAFEEKTLLE